MQTSDQFISGRADKRRHTCTWHTGALFPSRCPIPRLGSNGNEWPALVSIVTVDLENQRSPVISTTFPTSLSLCEYSWSSRIVDMTKDRAGRGLHRNRAFKKYVLSSGESSRSESPASAQNEWGKMKAVGN